LCAGLSSSIEFLFENCGYLGLAEAFAKVEAMSALTGRARANAENSAAARFGPTFRLRDEYFADASTSRVLAYNEAAYGCEGIGL
jgi:hypothetical protein